MDATWSKIRDYPNYEVSTDGRIRSLKTGRIMKESMANSGYPSIKLYKNGKHHSRQIHRIVAETFMPVDNDKLEVNHIDGNKTNNSVENLEWCTHSENTRHAMRNGLFTPYKLPSHPHEGRRVRIRETGETFGSLEECAKYIDRFKTAISACLHGKAKTHKGYHFEDA